MWGVTAAICAIISGNDVRPVLEYCASDNQTPSIISGVVAAALLVVACIFQCEFLQFPWLYPIQWDWTNCIQLSLLRYSSHSLGSRYNLRSVPSIPSAGTYGDRRCGYGPVHSYRGVLHLYRRGSDVSDSLTIMLTNVFTLVFK